MQNIFVTKIHIEKVKHLENVLITLSDYERKHLILTGKNGSGKTSLLEEMSECILLQQFNSGISDNYNIMSNHKSKLRNAFIKKPGVIILYNENKINMFSTTFVYITANRTQLTVPKSIETLQILGKTIVERDASKEFLKYILHLDYQLYGAKNDNNKALEKNLENWFNNFLTALRTIYDCQELKLQRDTKNLAFVIELKGREPFKLSEMSDGYAAFLKIYMELIMRFESSDGLVDYEKPAIVMIDELETHMHVELQKRVLPFLTQMFPNVQFIVATHSPFIISSLENAVVYDLEKKERLEKPSFYSYETIVESFLDTDTYSEELKRNMLY